MDNMLAGTLEHFLWTTNGKIFNNFYNKVLNSVGRKAQVVYFFNIYSTILDKFQLFMSSRISHYVVVDLVNIP